MADNPLQDALKNAVPLLQELFGAAITYTRGAYHCHITAIPPEDDTQIVDAQGVRTRSVGGEFGIKKSDLVLNSVTVTPARGDVITYGTSTYDVISWKEMKDTAEWRVTVAEAQV